MRSRVEFVNEAPRRPGSRGLADQGAARICYGTHGAVARWCGGCRQFNCPLPLLKATSDAVWLVVAGFRSDETVAASITMPPLGWVREKEDGKGEGMK